MSRKRCLNKAIEAVARGQCNYGELPPDGNRHPFILARNPKIRVPILAHLDFGGALYASPYHGISPISSMGNLPASQVLISSPSYALWEICHSPRKKYVKNSHGIATPIFNKEPNLAHCRGAVKQGHLPQLFKTLEKILFWSRRSDLCIPWARKQGPRFSPGIGSDGRTGRV